MGEEQRSERAGHAWPAPALQVEQDARAQQGKIGAQGGVYSASLKACRRSRLRVRPMGVNPGSAG